MHGDQRRPRPEGSLVHPIYQGTVYAVEPGTDYHDLRYHRLSTTPSQLDLHARLAALEGGEAAVATASGMAAITTTLLSLLRAGDHLLASDCLYGGTHDFLTEHAEDLGWSCSFVDTQRPETWAAAVTASTRVFLLETISNPLVRVPRLPEVAAFARTHGLVSVIDNTFATPVNFRPLAAGFDLVCHSATKYLNGHSDLVAGCVVGSAERIGRVRTALNHYGGALDPHAGYMLARGLQTLALRVAAQNANAAALARFLDEHPRVRRGQPPVAARASRPRPRRRAAVGLRRHVEPAPAGRRCGHAAPARRADDPDRRAQPRRRRVARDGAGADLARRDERRRARARRGDR